MRFTTLTAAVAAACAFSASATPVTIPDNTYHPPGSLELSAWMEETIWSFFPNRTGWDTKYDEIYDTSLKATFGFPGTTAPENVYNFTTWKQLYGTLFAKISHDLSNLSIEIQDIVSYPFPGNKGGYVYVTGLEYGAHKDGSFAGISRDASFFVVHEINGQRKIVEQRESSNYIVQ